MNRHSGFGALPGPASLPLPVTDSIILVYMHSISGSQICPDLVLVSIADIISEVFSTASRQAQPSKAVTRPDVSWSNVFCFMLVPTLSRWCINGFCIFRMS